MALGAQTTYEQVVAEHHWEVPDRYNIAADVCDAHPREKLAMVHEHFSGAVREVTWGELQDLANQAANVLAGLGVQRGDRVAVVLPPTPETAAVFFGVWKLGAILLSMSVLYGDEGIRHRLTDSQSMVLVTDRRQCAALRREPGRADARARRGHAGRRVQGVHDRRHRGRRSRRSSTTPRARPGWPRGSCTRIATCLPTRSSSTATTCATASASTGWANGPGRPGSPRCSGRGASARCSTCCSARAASQPDRQLDFLSRHEVTNVFTTPTAMRSMMAITDAGTRYPQRFRIVCSAGEPLNPEAIRWFREQYGLTVLDFYGLTEGYPLCANFPFMEVREGSMGRPMPGWDVVAARRGRAAGGPGRAR